MQGVCAYQPAWHDISSMTFCCGGGITVQCLLLRRLLRLLCCWPNLGLAAAWPALMRGCCAVLCSAVVHYGAAVPHIADQAGLPRPPSSHTFSSCLVPAAATKPMADALVAVTTAAAIAVAAAACRTIQLLAPSGAATGVAGSSAAAAWHSCMLLMASSAAGPGWSCLGANTLLYVVCGTTSSSGSCNGGSFCSVCTRRNLQASSSCSILH
jgi:hypothetical protein